MRSLLLAAAVAVLWPSAPLHAQGWEAPRLVGPYTPLDRGALWFRLPEDEGGGDGILGTWRPSFWAPAFSIRAGGVVGGTSERGFAGVDVRAPLYLEDLALVWTSGLGASVGEEVRVTLPLQLSVSQVWSTGDLWTAPYLSAGAALEWRDDGDSDVDEFRAHPVLELGLDLTVDPGRRWVLRTGVGLVGRKGFAVGLALPY